MMSEQRERPVRFFLARCIVGAHDELCESTDRTATRAPLASGLGHGQSALLSRAGQLIRVGITPQQKGFPLQIVHS